MLALDRIGVDFDYRPVLEDVDMVFERSRRYALSAQNGSGKTTLLHVMAGLLRPSRGRVMWNDQPFSSMHRHQIGVVLQQPFLYADLTGEENLRLYARLYGMKAPERCATMWMQRVELSDVSNLRVKEYSKGMRQRLSIARALMHRPACLLLDEPYDGLDQASRALFQSLFSEAVHQGAMLFLVTHLDSETHADDVRLTIRKGRLVRATC